MAHEIWENNVFTGQGIKPWHNLGVTVEGTVTWQEAIKLAGLDWTVKKEPLYSAKGVELETWGIFREGKDGDVFLGSVGKGYVPIQNKNAFEFIDAMIGNEGAHYDTAGALGYGERIFCSAYLPAAGFEVVPDDKHQIYLLFKTSHDGTMSALCKLTDIRVVCQNTLNRALASDGHDIVIKHTRNADVRIEQAKKLIVSGKKTAQALRDKMVYLSTIQFNKKKIQKVFDSIFPNKKGDVSTRTAHNIEKILELFESNDKNAFPVIRGTGYNLVNAFTEYADHFRSVKSGTKDDEVKRILRTESALFGSAEKFKSEAFEYIYAQAA